MIGEWSECSCTDLYDNMLGVICGYDPQCGNFG